MHRPKYSNHNKRHVKQNVTPIRTSHSESEQESD